MLLHCTGDPASSSPISSSPAPLTEVPSIPSRVAILQAENIELRAELERLRAERAALLDRQQRVAELIGAKSPEHLIHDIRNVLNERALLRALTEDQLK